MDESDVATLDSPAPDLIPTRKPRTGLKQPRTPFGVDEPIPNQLGNIELARALNVKISLFYKRKAAGKYRRFEFRHPAEPTKPYSGALVKRYLKAGAR